MIFSCFLLCKTGGGENMLALGLRFHQQQQQQQQLQLTSNTKRHIESSSISLRSSNLGGHFSWKCSLLTFCIPISGLWVKDPELTLKEGYLDFTSSLPCFPDLLLSFSVGPGPSPIRILADISGCSLGKENGAGAALAAASPKTPASDTKASEAFGAPKRLLLPQVWDSSGSPPLRCEKEEATGIPQLMLADLS